MKSTMMAAAILASLTGAGAAMDLRADKAWESALSEGARAVLAANPPRGQRAAVTGTEALLQQDVPAPAPANGWVVVNGKWAVIVFPSPEPRDIWRWNIPDTRENALEYSWMAHIDTVGGKLMVGYSCWKSPGSTPESGTLAQLLATCQADAWNCAGVTETLCTRVSGVALGRIRNADGVGVVILDEAVVGDLSSSRPAEMAISIFDRADSVEVKIPVFHYEVNPLSVSEEGWVKGKLGELRSLLSIYYGDKEGRYPAHLSELVPDYISVIPTVSLPGTAHDPTSEVVVITSNVKDFEELASLMRDTGKWIYVSNPDSPMDGALYIDCSHRDSKGQERRRY